MTFKEPHMMGQLIKSPAKLREIAYEFDRLSKEMGVGAVVTRVWTPINAPESGVHQQHRAVDFRNQLPNKMRLYSDKQVCDLVKEMNSKFPREDSKQVCIHHSANGAPFHWHLQIPLKWLTPDEKKFIEECLSADRERNRKV